MNGNEMHAPAVSLAQNFLIYVSHSAPVLVHSDSHVAVLCNLASSTRTRMYDRCSAPLTEFSAPQASARAGSRQFWIGKSRVPTYCVCGFLMELWATTL